MGDEGPMLGRWGRAWGRPIGRSEGKRLKGRTEMSTKVEKIGWKTGREIVLGCSTKALSEFISHNPLLSLISQSLAKS